MGGFGGLIAVCVAFFLGSAFACLAEDAAAELVPTESETRFLDRLMRAESGGRPHAKNPASTALGPFQFLENTFLEIVRRKFPALASGKNDAQILALRTNVQVSRDVALIYVRENATALGAKGKEATAANLRLAFFAGAGGALRVLEAHPDELVSRLLSQAAVSANPFLRTMTARQLLARARREAEGLGGETVAAQTAAAEASATEAQAAQPAATQQVAAEAPAKQLVATQAAAAQPDTQPGATPAIAKKAPPKNRASAGVVVRCNLGLASCRHWLALAEKRVAVNATRLQASQN